MPVLRHFQSVLLFYVFMVYTSTRLHSPEISTVYPTPATQLSFCNIHLPTSPIFHLFTFLIIHFPTIPIIQHSYPCIRRKTDWARKWIGDERSSFATRLVSAAIVEGLFFSSSFTSTIWIKKKNIQPGLCLSIISRDESLHVAHAVMLYGKLQDKLSNIGFSERIKEAVDIQIEFITLAIPCRMIGMNSTSIISLFRIPNLFQIDYLCNWDMKKCV